MRAPTISLALPAAALCSLLSGACDSRDRGSYGQPDDHLQIVGSGASSPGTLYATWTREYANVDNTVSLNYQATGSGAGVKAILAGSVDLGGTDEPIADAALGGRPMVQIPSTLGAVAVAYQLPGGPAHLHLTPELLSAILLGEVSSWSHPEILALNPDAKLPSLPIRLVLRMEDSGTTTLMSTYLGSLVPRWASKVGVVGVIKPLAGSPAIAVHSNDQLLRELRSNEGSLAFLSFSLVGAGSARLSTAALRNQAGRFVAPSLEGTSAAAAKAEDLRSSLLNSPGEATYPIVAFTYLVTPQNIADPRRGKAVAKLLWWLTHDGQTFAPALGFATLPAEVLIRTESALYSLTAGGAPALAR